MTQHDLLNGLADIALPTPPQWWPYIIAMIATVLIIIVISLIIWRAVLRKKEESEMSVLSRGQRKLSNISRDWQQGRIDDREASYRLAALLRLGLGLPQLTAVCPAALHEHAALWARTITLFDQLRYSQSSATRLSPEIFIYIETWLQTAATARHAGA